MFDKAIIDTDRFMDLSMSAKALYFLLGMEADDEGFVSYKKVMRIHGGNQDDIKILIVKDFLIHFDSGVVVITDWNKNNFLDSRRIKLTEYEKEKALLTKKDNKYIMLSTGLATAKQSLSQSSIEQNRIEQNRIEQNNIAKSSDIANDSIEINVEIEKNKQIAKILDAFKDINPMINFGNKTQRKACNDLIEKFGFEKTMTAIAYYKTIQAEIYSPVITTPLMLKNKMAELRVFYNKSQSPKKGAMTII